MTRDEAIAKLGPTPGCGVRLGMQTGETVREAADRHNADVCLFIDRLAALGLLDLEEPKTAAYQKAVEALEEGGWHLGVLTLLDRAGLKIVEKDNV